jgi:hypothetical protein
MKSKQRTNVRSNDWKIIARHLDKRKGKQSIVHLNGRRLSSEKVRRGVSRNFLSTFERLQQGTIPLLIRLAIVQRQCRVLSTTARRFHYQHGAVVTD